VYLDGENVSIKYLRKTINLTQKEASKLVNIPLRIYVNYVNYNTKRYTIKYKYIMKKLVKIEYY